VIDRVLDDRDPVLVGLRGLSEAPGGDVLGLRPWRALATLPAPWRLRVRLEHGGETIELTLGRMREGERGFDARETVALLAALDHDRMRRAGFAHRCAQRAKGVGGPVVWIGSARDGVLGVSGGCAGLDPLGATDRDLGSLLALGGATLVEAESFEAEVSSAADQGEEKGKRARRVRGVRKTKGRAKDAEVPALPGAADRGYARDDADAGDPTGVDRSGLEEWSDDPLPDDLEST